MDNSKLYWYNSTPWLFDEARKELPGMKNWFYFHQFFAKNLSLTDRYETIRLPIQTEVHPACRAPEYQKLNLDYEIICYRRARELMDLAKETDRKIFIMYSGGIDSSAIIVSFLNACRPEEIKKHIVVGLSEISILENPTLYRNFIRKNFVKVPSHAFPQYLGDKNYITLTGEGNDQLYGSAVLNKITKAYPEMLFAEPTHDNLMKCYALSIKDEKGCEKLIEIFDPAIRSSAVPLQTIFHYYWYINFRFKWQNVYMRVLAFAKKQDLTPQDNYFTFFHTNDFQLWAMNNPDKLIKDTWLSYKFTAKNFIYKTNRDINYRDRKAKIGSLGTLVRYKDEAMAITDQLEKIMDPLPVSYWNSDNDFV